jgi:hypothetical protein
MGGLDIFKWNFETESTALPENLKPPFNSNGDDFGIIFKDDGSGYFTSNRVGGLGSDDIYRFTSSKEESKSENELSESDVQDALSGVSKLINNEICELEGKTQVVNVENIFPNPNDGNFSLQLNASNSMKTNVRIYTSSGKLAHEKPYSLNEGRNKLTFNLNPLPAGIYYVQFNSDCEVLGFKKFIVQ